MMSTAVVTAFPSKADQENRLKSRKVSKQSGLKPPNRLTENGVHTKKHTSYIQATPRRALNELSSNVPPTSRQSETKCQGHTTVGIPPTYTKRQGTGASVKKTKVDKLTKLSSKDFPDIEALPNTLSSSIEPPFVSPFYFKELSSALKHTSYMPQTVHDPPQQPVLSLSVSSRPLSTHESDMMTIDLSLPDDVVQTHIGDEGSLLELPELPNFDF